MPDEPLYADQKLCRFRAGTLEAIARAKPGEMTVSDYIRTAVAACLRLGLPDGVDATVLSRRQAIELVGREGLRNFYRERFESGGGDEYEPIGREELRRWAEHVNEEEQHG